MCPNVRDMIIDDGWSVIGFADPEPSNGLSQVRAATRGA